MAAVSLANGDLLSPPAVRAARCQAAADSYIPLAKDLLKLEHAAKRRDTWGSSAAGLLRSLTLCPVALGMILELLGGDGGSKFALSVRGLAAISRGAFVAARLSLKAGSEGNAIGCSGAMAEESQLVQKQPCSETSPQVQVEPLAAVTALGPPDPWAHTELPMQSALLPSEQPQLQLRARLVDPKDELPGRAEGPLPGHGTKPPTPPAQLAPAARAQMPRAQPLPEHSVEPPAPPAEPAPAPLGQELLAEVVLVPPMQPALAPQAGPAAAPLKQQSPPRLPATPRKMLSMPGVGLLLEPGEGSLLEPGRPSSPARRRRSCSSESGGSSSRGSCSSGEIREDGGQACPDLPPPSQGSGNLKAEQSGSESSSSFQEAYDEDAVRAFLLKQRKQLVDKHQLELRKQQAQLEEKHGQQLQDIRSKHKQLVEELQADHARELRNLRAENRKHVDSIAALHRQLEQARCTAHSAAGIADGVSTAGAIEAKPAQAEAPEGMSEAHPSAVTDLHDQLQLAAGVASGEGVPPVEPFMTTTAAGAAGQAPHAQARAGQASESQDEPLCRSPDTEDQDIFQTSQIDDACDLDCFQGPDTVLEDVIGSNAPVKVGAAGGVTRRGSTTPNSGPGLPVPDSDTNDCATVGLSHLPRKRSMAAHAGPAPKAPLPPCRRDGSGNPAPDCSGSSGASDSEGTETKADRANEDLVYSFPPLPMNQIEAHLQRIRPLVLPGSCERPPHDMTRAMGGILIAGVQSLASGHRSALIQQGVSHVVSCCSVAPGGKYGKHYLIKAPSEFRHLQLEFDDSPYVAILRLLRPVTDFLSSKPADKSALIHCHEGTNRCATLAVAMRMVELVRARERHACEVPMCPGDLLGLAWGKVAEYRGGPIITNLGFQRQLLLFAHLLLRTHSQVGWPKDWGPEAWLAAKCGSSPTPGAVQRCRALRAKVEEACLQSGMSMVDAICATARIIDLWTRRGHLG